MSRTEMMDQIISIYGFEARETINFCQIAENIADIDAVIMVYGLLLERK